MSPLGPNRTLQDYFANFHILILMNFSCSQKFLIATVDSFSCFNLLFTNCLNWFYSIRKTSDRTPTTHKNEPKTREMPSQILWPVETCNLIWSTPLQVKCPLHQWSMPMDQGKNMSHEPWFLTTFFASTHSIGCKTSKKQKTGPLI